MSAAEAVRTVAGTSPTNSTAARTKLRILFIITHLLLFFFVSTRIITQLFTNCNPFFEINYIFVTLFSTYFWLPLLQPGENRASTGFQRELAAFSCYKLRELVTNCTQSFPVDFLRGH